MKSRRLHRPSPSLVIACFALAFSMAGTGYAAVKINGDVIKKGTVAGTALKKNTLTGMQINEAKLGKVPSATNADNASTAANAAALAGSSQADFARNANFVRVFKSMNVGDEDITLVSSGDIAVKMSCRNYGGLDHLDLYAKTSSDGGLLNSEQDDVNPLLASTDPDGSRIDPGVSAGPGDPADADGYDDTGFVINAASTHVITMLEGSGSKLLNRSGHGCIYGGTFIVE